MSESTQTKTVTDKNESKNEKRKYKDTVFHDLFKDTANFIEMYNALSGQSVDPKTAKVIDVTRTTNKILSLIDEVAMKINGKLVVVIETKSFEKDDLFYRFLSYVDLVYDQSIDGDFVGKIQIPEFYFLCRIDDYSKAEETIRYSEEYGNNDTVNNKSSVDIAFKVIYINNPDNDGLLQKSDLLLGYQKLMSKVDELCGRQRRIKEKLSGEIRKEAKELGEDIGIDIGYEIGYERGFKIGFKRGMEQVKKEVCEFFPKVCRMFRENKSDKEIIDELHLSDKNFDFYKKLYNKTKDLY